MHIAILGAGGLGCCAALELAQQGHSVDLFDQEMAAVRGASRVNEGKIHQGFIYANDPSGSTSRLMAQGALSFAQNLAPWIDLDERTLVTSTPFVYAVHRDTMVDVDRLRRHFEECASTINELQAATGATYLMRDEPASFHELARTELGDILDPEPFLAAFATSELAVDPRPIAAALQVAVLSHPKVNFRGSSRVTGVSVDRQGYRVAFETPAPSIDGPYDKVANALWEGRLAVDRTMGVATDRLPMYRHKFGNRVLIPLRPEDIPSVTIILGPFGDIVNFGQNGIYLSWYPIGMVESTFALEPPRGWTDFSDEARRDVFRRSFAEWVKFCPKLATLPIEAEQIDPSSGIIFAWGASDIDDPASQLHERHSIGIESRGGYHSVNTGKYTTIPMLALEVAQRVMAGG